MKEANYLVQGLPLVTNNFDITIKPHLSPVVPVIEVPQVLEVVVDEPEKTDYEKVFEHSILPAKPLW